MLRRLFTLLLISMLPILAMGQNGTVYPIDLSVMMTPPYGTCLKEYVGSDRIVVQALLKDFSKKSEQFVVQLKVTDNRNRVVLLTHFGGYDFPAGKTFTYPMGPNADQGDKSNVLYQLFANATIQPKNECFEEGAYTFEFQAFQAASYPSRKIALSMPFRYPVFLQGNTVQPLQIYPYENEVICSHAFEYTNENGMKRNATQLNGIAYQWQSANPTGMRVGYLLQVVDLGLIGDKKWKDIKSEAGGIFGKVDKASYRVNEVTYTPFHNHAFSAANYEENHAYAWRVLALVGKDLELGTNASVYNNNAPVRVFYICGAPGLEKDDYEVIKDDREFDKNLHKVKMDTIKSTDLNALALWRDSSVKDDYCGVNVEIRKKGQEKWTPFFVEMTNKYDASIEPTDNSYSFTNLSYNTRYEVRAQYVKCDNCADRTTGCVYAPYSDPLEFVIAQPIDSATCGSALPKLADCGEGAKAPKILAGDTIIANGTKVVVDSVSYPNASDSSIITGKGHICMPIVKNIQLKMEFNDIQVNCAKELVKGKIKSIWDERTCAMINIDELTGEGSTGGKDNSASDATLEEYSEEKAKTSPAGTLFVDGKKVKLKTKEGEVVEIGETIELSAQQYQSKNFLSDNSHYIEFYNEDKVNNAFDNDGQGYYRKMSTYEYFDNPNNKVVLPWLANNPGKQKTIKAREVNKKSESAKFESVMFVIPSGSNYIKLDAQQDKDGNYELKIPGWADVDHSTPIYAIARNSAESSYFDAGKMMQANYAERTHKLIIVPTHEDYSADVSKIQEQLNAIYGRVGVTYTVEEDRSFVDNFDSHCILVDGLDISADKESHWNVETKEMKDLRSLYEKNHPNMDKKAAYLFLVNFGEYPYTSVEGDMPRNQSVGYIFMNETKKLDDGRLVAHELGHGVYKFQHTFDYKELSDLKEKTDNLMDYAGGDFLAHYQWRVMQDSVMFVWKGLQDDEDGLWTTDGHFYLFTYLSVRIGNDYETAFKYGKMSEEPDTEFKIENGVVRAFENNTWMIGGLQQLYHVLNDNFHGVQLAATTWAILNMDLFPDGEKYLYHRFGDAFAHINGHTKDSEMNDWNKTIPLRQYYESIDNFLNDEISSLGLNSYDDFGRKIKANLVYSIMATKNIPSLGGTSWGFMELSQNLLNRLPAASQNAYRMFGQPAGDNDQATRGHAPNPGSSVDDILRHRELFHLYARNALELLLMKEQLGVDVESIMQDVDKIIRTTYDAIAYGNRNKDKVQSDNINSEKIDEGWKLDAIWNFHTHMLLMERENLSEITFTLPYKYLLPEKALDPRLMHDITITPLGDWNISFDSNTFVNEPGIAYYVVYDGWSSSDFNRTGYAQMISLRRMRDKANHNPRFLRQYIFPQAAAEELRNLEDRMAKSPYSKDMTDNQKMVVSGPVANCVKFLRSYLMLSHERGDYTNYDFDLRYSDENVQITVKRTK